MSDTYSSLIDEDITQQHEAGLGGAVGFIEGKPEQAVRAVELGKATGVDPNIIYPDVENFDRQTKTNAAAGIIRNNQEMMRYLAKQPMAAKIANDDYGNLDEMSQAIRKVGDPKAWDRIRDATQAGWGEGPLGNWAKDMVSPDSGELRKLSWATLTAATSPIEVMFRGFGAATYGLAQLLGERYQMATGANDAEKNRLIRDVIKGVEANTAGPGFAHPAGSFHIAVEGLPKMRAKVVGDAIDMTKLEVDGLQEGVKIAQQSQLRERSPEMFAEFAREHVGNHQIGIDANAVRALYGDKVPHPEDGMLGWVPDIQRQLEVAEAIGSDVRIPLADWYARVDPKVAKDLHDFTRVRPESLTLAEGDALKTVEPRVSPEPTLDLHDSAVNIARAMAGFEPKMAELKLKKVEKGTESAYEGGHIFHDFEMLNENGKSVGYTILTERDGGKTLYVEEITGHGGYKPKDFGPKLMRDLLRQIKEQFPNAENIAGYRVSGAREKAGTYTSHGEIKMALPDAEGAQPIDIKRFQELVHGGEWMDAGQGVDVLIKRSEKMTEKQAQLVSDVEQIMKRIAPDVQSAPAVRIESQGQKVRGLYLDGERGANALIMYSLEDPAPGNTARHEVIHYLRKRGFFKPEEWAVLEKAAEEGKWLDEKTAEWYTKYYKDLTDEQLGGMLLEEAVAYEYPRWAKRMEERIARGDIALSPLDQVFAKIKYLIDTIRQRIKDMFGYVPTVEELFEKIEKGEIGRRKGDTRDVSQGPLAAADEVTPSELKAMEERDLFDQASAIGMTVDQYRRYMKKIGERRVEDMEKASKRALEKEKREQTQTWKDNRVEMQKEVAEDFKLRPDLAADSYLRNGELFGTQTGAKVKLGREFLTEDAISRLPEKYIADRGVHPDDLAQLFGYPNGKAMLERLTALHEAEKASNMNHPAFRRRLVDAEVDRRMEQKYGNLNENILEAVKDQVFSETQLDLLHEETIAAAERAKTQLTFTKDQVKAWVDAKALEMPLSEMSSEKFMKDAAKAGREAEFGLLKDDPQYAFKAKQQQFYASAFARKAVEIERDQLAFEKTAKRYVPREVKSRDQEFTNYVQDLLSRAGYKMRTAPEEIQSAISHAGHGSLGEFVDYNRQYLGYEPQVTEALANGNVKPLDKMTVGEFLEFKEAIDSLDFIGKEVNKVNLAGEKADLAVFRQEVVDNLRTLPQRSRASQRNGKGNIFYWIDASLTRMEQLTKDFDLRQELGPMYSALITPMMRSKAKSYDLTQWLSDYFKGVKGEFGKDWRNTLQDSIPHNLMYDPLTRAPMDLKRENLLQIMLNWGTRSNIEKLTGAYATLEGQMKGLIEPGKVASKEQRAAFEARLKALIDAHATERDWQWVQAMWKPFAELRPQIETVARNMTGISPKWTKPEMLSTRFGDIEGGHWPVKYDRLGSNLEVIVEKTAMDALFQPTYRSTSTAQGYLKARTGYMDYVDLNTSIEQAAGVLQQTIHDISYRDALVQASKVVRDRGIRDAIRNHYGIEYEKQLLPWLQRIANKFPNMDASMRGWEEGLRWFRLNTIANALPLNLKVLLSPGVGVPNPKLWAEFIANYSANKTLAMDKSGEIRHMVYNLDRDFSQIMEQEVAKGRWSTAQAKAVEWGFKPAMVIEQQFRMFTFVDQYKKALERGRTEVEAVEIADSFVRTRHGAASVVDLPAALASSESMKAWTMFMGYFNTMYNWQREIPGAVRRGDWATAGAAALGTIAVGAFFNATLYSSKKENESWWKTIGRGLALEPLSYVPFARDASAFILEGHHAMSAPVGLAKAMYDVYKDIEKKATGKKVEKPIQHGANVVGLATRLPGMQIGKTGQFAYDVATGQQRPRNFQEWFYGIVNNKMRNK